MLRGQQVYGQALKSMQQALYDPHWMKHDETLAAARCMVLYESFESTSESMSSWMDHINGVARIIQLRGPKRHREPLQRTILESTRYNAMIASMARRQASFFAQPQWLTEPWTDDTKNFEQRSVDQGFLLSSLFEKADDLLLHRGDSDDVSLRRDVFHMLRRLLDGLSALQAINEELVEVESQYARFKPAGYNVKDLCIPQTGEASILGASATIIALELSFATLAEALHSRYNGLLLQQHDDDDDDDDNTSILDEIAPYLDQNWKLTLSRQLLGDLETCLQGSFEFTRARLIYPLNTVRWEVRKYPEDCARVRKLFDLVAAKGKYRIAQSVHKAGISTVPAVFRHAAMPAK